VVTTAAISGLAMYTGNALEVQISNQVIMWMKSHDVCCCHQSNEIMRLHYILKLVTVDLLILWEFYFSRKYSVGSTKLNSIFTYMIIQG